MVKRYLVLGVIAPCLFSPGPARALWAVADGEASAPAGASATVAVEPVPDRAAAAGEAPPEGQADDRTFWELIEEDNPNPATYEIGFVSIALNQTFGLVNWRGGGIYFGAGGGVGTPVYRISQMEDRDVGIDPMIEAIFGQIFLRISPVEFVDVDLGGRLALGATTYDIDDAPRGGFVRGGYGDLRVGSRKVKLGPRFEYDDVVYAGFREQGWKLTPLMLRVVND